MKTYIQKAFQINGKTLLLTAASLKGGQINADLVTIVEDAFKNLAPYIKDDFQTIYIRDIDFLAIDGKYPGGHCYNRHEVMIAVPSWPVDEKQLSATVNHELHHLARWQNAGYGFTLGGALLSEGIATYYEKLASGWTPPWSEGEVKAKAIEAAIKEYDSDSYDHSSWFYSGEFGKWTGYIIGYKIAEKLYSNGFNLEDSILITPDKVLDILEKMLD